MTRRGARGEACGASVLTTRYGFGHAERPRWPGQVSGLDFEGLRKAYVVLWSNANPLFVTTIGRATMQVVKALTVLQPSEPEVLRAVLVLLENPLLLSPALYHIVIQQVASLMVKLSDTAWLVLDAWIGRLPKPFAHRIVQVHKRAPPGSGGIVCARG